MSEPREIYLKACCEVAAAFELMGFRWRKSRQNAVKKQGDLTFRLWFQSSFRNALLQESFAPVQNKAAPLKSDRFMLLELTLAEIERFGNVAFMAHVSVHAASIKKWRATLPNPIRVDDGVAGTNIGYLASENPAWLEVNLANPATRQARTAAMVDLITTSGFPYFNRFRHPDEVVASLIDSSDPGMMDYMELEYAVCYGSTQIGAKVLQRHLNKSSGGVDEYRRALLEYRQNGIPAALDGRPGPRLARTALSLGIEK